MSLCVVIALCTGRCRLRCRVPSWLCSSDAQRLRVGAAPSAAAFVPCDCCHQTCRMPSSPRGHRPGGLASAGHRTLETRSLRNGAAPGVLRRREDGLYAVIKVPSPVGSVRHRNDHAETGQGAAPRYTAPRIETASPRTLNHIHQRAIKLLDGLTHMHAITSYSLRLSSDMLGAPDTRPRDETYLQSNTEENVYAYYTPAASEGARELFNYIRARGSQPTPYTRSLRLAHLEG